MKNFGVVDKTKLLYSFIYFNTAKDKYKKV